MKNNILLIIAVTVISVGIITAVIVLSTVGKNSGESSGSSSQSSQTSSSSETDIPLPETEPAVTMVTEKETAESAPATDESVTDEPVAPEAEGIVSTAKSLLGVEFVDGGETPDGFDNSGFIYYVLRQNGYITCPRGVMAQSQMGTALTYDKLKSGDLVFFMNDGSTAAGFGGIYIGDGKMIACLMPGTVVKEVDITTTYYKDHFYGGVSLS